MRASMNKTDLSLFLRHYKPGWNSSVKIQMPEFQFPGCIDCLFRPEKFSVRSWVDVYRWREWRPGTRGPPSTRRSSSGPWTSVRSAGRYLHQPGNNKVKIIVTIIFFPFFSALSILLSLWRGRGSNLQPRTMAMSWGVCCHFVTTGPLVLNVW